MVPEPIFLPSEFQLKLNKKSYENKAIKYYILYTFQPVGSNQYSWCKGIIVPLAKAIILFSGKNIALCRRPLLKPCNTRFSKTLELLLPGLD